MDLEVSFTLDLNVCHWDSNTTILQCGIARLMAYVNIFSIVTAVFLPMSILSDVI
jgi:hypothetical protein